MCGIAGYVLNFPATAPFAFLEAQLEPLRARGPVDEGVCLVLRNRRSVIELSSDRTVPAARSDRPHLGSEAGRAAHDLALFHTRFPVRGGDASVHQPFVSRDGGVVGVLDGAIYNHVELRDQLRGLGVEFRGSSEVEVLVEGYRVWGDDLWTELNGRWAAALYDARSRTLTLSRDRLGITPLYLRETDEGMFFSSLITPLRDVDPSGTRINESTLRGFIEVGLKDFGAATCSRSIRALPAANLLSLGPTAPAEGVDELCSYWTAPDRSYTPQDIPFQEAVTSIRDTLFDAVALRLRADAPLAFELSSGMDSSSVVAAAAASHSHELITYTLTYPGSNEEPLARRMAEHFSLDYRVLNSDEPELIGQAESFAERMEEPYHAPNVFTHFRMRERMKADGIDVALCGSGGDAIFAGDDTLFWPAARRELKALGYDRQALVGEAFFRLGTWPRARDTLWATMKWPKRVVVRWLRERTGDGAGAADPPVPKGGDSQAARLFRGYGDLSFLQQRRFDLEVGPHLHYAVTDDRFTMSIPLEQRNPMLDHRLVELGLSLPAAYMFRNGWTKYVLRKAMEPFLPKRVVWRRKKMGFPLRLRPLLRSNRAFLAPLVDEVVATGVLASAPPAYDDLVQADPARLWRICSTGLWLRSGAAPGPGPTTGKPARVGAGT